MNDLPFSRRYETRRPSGGLIYDELPDAVLDGLLNIFGTMTYEWHGDGVRVLIRNLYKALDRRIDWSTGNIDELVSSLDWDEYCDACEALWTLFRENSQDYADRFSNELNALFGRQYFGYEMRDGKIERVGTAAHEAVLADVRVILRDDDMTGPDTQFQKALEFFNRRPEPDSENCVKESIGALEGTARVLLGDDNILLPAALDRIGEEKGIHPALKESLKKYYAYRGDAGGVAHGMTEQEVRPEDAELVVSLSASAIVYLARLYGRHTVAKPQIQ